MSCQHCSTLVDQITSGKCSTRGSRFVFTVVRWMREVCVCVFVLIISTYACRYAVMDMCCLFVGAFVAMPMR